MKFFIVLVHSTAHFSSKRKNFGIHYGDRSTRGGKYYFISRGVFMDEELNYAEMLEIPVETVT
ncbi:MAG: hypothetical protein K2K12_06610, partial [Clostridia bacterium]|nr:hypothetical protein [Clostridia bacterium]